MNVKGPRVVESKVDADYGTSVATLPQAKAKTGRALAQKEKAHPSGWLS